MSGGGGYTLTYLKFLASHGHGHMGSPIHFTAMDNYSLSCRSGYFRPLPGTRHNRLIHKGHMPRVCLTRRVGFHFPCRLRWREAAARFQLWFQTPAMKASSSEARSEALPAASHAADDWLFLSAESVAPPPHLHASADGREAEDRGKLKSKLVSAWNSVKYGLLTVVCISCIDKTQSHSLLVPISCLRLVLQTKVQIWPELASDYAWEILRAQGARSGTCAP